MTDDNVQQCMNKLDNLEKIDKFFKICNLLRQNHEQTENLRMHHVMSDKFSNVLR